MAKRNKRRVCSLSDPGTDDGYILWGAMFGHDQYLMNTCGEVVHTWVGDGLSLGNSMYLLEDGTLLRCAKADTANGSLIIAGGGGERIQKVDWNGNVTWDFVYYDAESDCITISHQCRMGISWRSRGLEGPIGMHCSW
ncbi:MAG: hypothetical protein IPH05_18495 [Flavobacteriales bacterium]|nr:hypothetical protein [Flavobacteriales bacterium]